MGTPYLLCGTKSDLYEPGNKYHVHEDEATDFAKRYKAWANVRCSAMENTNLDTLFKNVLKCGLGEDSKFLKTKDGKGCVLM
mmetsp:Transcript_28433/g.34722  ORF Transcript_28433/g.34722 Transcript_28433/m.34722 type:complete len:82 (+) Transcript_28433:383-628(+)